MAELLIKLTCYVCILFLPTKKPALKQHFGLFLYPEAPNAEGEAKPARERRSLRKSFRRKKVRRNCKKEIASSV